MMGRVSYGLWNKTVEVWVWRGGLDWIDLGHGWDLVNGVMKLRVP